MAYGLCDYAVAVLNSQFITEDWFAMFWKQYIGDICHIFIVLPSTVNAAEFCSTPLGSVTFHFWKLDFCAEHVRLHLWFMNGQIQHKDELVFASISQSCFVKEPIDYYLFCFVLLEMGVIQEWNVLLSVPAALSYNVKLGCFDQGFVSNTNQSFYVLITKARVYLIYLFCC